MGRNVGGALQSARVVGVRLTVTYESAEQLLADYEQQWARGGLLVRVGDPPNLPRDTSLQLRIVTPFGETTVDANVLQVLPGMGVAVSFDHNDATVQGFLSRARGGGGEPAASLPDAGLDPAPEPEAAPVEKKKTFVRRHVPNAAVDSRTRIKNATQAEKMQIALYGNREERGLIIRDNNRALHQFVLKNAKIQIDEVASIAAMRTVNPEVLNFIASRREWSSRPEIALALVRNPKMPVGIAIKMVDNCSPTALRQLSKAAGLRAPILRAVRRKVLR